jgi:hypothetical protein
MTLVTVKADSVGEAWQLALARVLREGDAIKTEYDAPGDPLSRDATAAVEVREPLAHPAELRGRPLELTSRAGNRWAVYGCAADTYLVGAIQANYIEEVVNGINDRYLWESEKSFPYSYHDRIFHYRAYAPPDALLAPRDLTLHPAGSLRGHAKLRVDGEGMWEHRPGSRVRLPEGGNGERLVPPGVDAAGGGGGVRIPLELVDLPEVDQLRPVVEKLKESPHSRRCQFVIWRPYADPFSPDPPCLQRGWLRVSGERLTLQTSWRSRDLFRAWEANVNGMLRIQAMVAGELGAEVGPYVDFSNSLHVYGSTFGELLELLERMRNRGHLHPELEEQVDPLREAISSA